MSKRTRRRLSWVCMLFAAAVLLWQFSEIRAKTASNYPYWGK